MVTLFRQRRSIPAVLLAVMLLALVNWILNPDEALRWIRGMLLLPALWLGMMLWHRSMLESRRRRGLDDEAGIRLYFDSAVALLFLAVGLRQIIYFGLEIWVEVGAREPGLELERRALGLASSAVFIILGNALPKILTPLSLLPLEQGELVTAARRFAGMTMLILGLVTAIAYLSAPLAIATALLRWATVAVLLTVLGAIVWMNVSAARRNG